MRQMIRKYSGGLRLDAAVDRVRHICNDGRIVCACDLAVINRRKRVPARSGHARRSRASNSSTDHGGGKRRGVIVASGGRGIFI